MSFSPEGLADSLDLLERNLLASGAPPNRHLVALSGGLDSIVLCHALAAARPDGRLLAIHVDHQLQAESGGWAEFCIQFCRDLGMECVVRRASVDAGGGPEAAARQARYAALESLMEPGDWLLSAHHREDQAETLLLNLLRGSGPTGIAGIPRLRRFGPGFLARPLLDVARVSLERYATDQKLRWIEDPSNDQSVFDRNFLRRDVLPLLEQRWPNVSGRLAKSAAHARDAAGILSELGDFDLAQLAGLTPPNRTHVEEIRYQLSHAREDALPVVAWPGGEFRRYRDNLYLLSAAPLASFDGCTFDSVCDLGPGMGQLELTPGPGVSTTCVDAGLCLGIRQGGEEIRLPNQRHKKKLKKLLQEAGVVPWMRDRLPLVYSGDHLVAVADLWTDASVTDPNGLAIRWRDKPALL